MVRFLYIIFCLVVTSNAFGVIYYVKPIPSGSGDGSSWANATSFTNALSLVNNGDEIRMYDGTYLPATQTSFFAVTDNITITGGYFGTTRIGGNLGAGGYCYKLMDVNITGTLYLNDIIFNEARGYLSYTGSLVTANSTVRVVNGNITLNNCDFLRNGAHEGVIYLENGSQTLTATNCTFTDNDIDLFAIYTNQGSAYLTDCTFDDNVGAPGGGFGGCVYNEYGSGVMRIERCTFTNNSSWGLFGVVEHNPTNANTSWIRNCTFYNNSPAAIGLHGGNQNTSIEHCSFYGNATAVSLNNSTNVFSVRNCIIWGNTTEIYTNNSPTYTVTYCDIEGGGFSGVGNMNLDPRFNSPGTGDLSIIACSPCIQAGDNTGASATDILGNSRIFSSVTDMGAYEYQGLNTAIAPTTYNCTPASGTSGSSRSLSASGGLGSYQWFANECGGTPFATGSPVSVSPASTTTYYVNTINGACQSMCRAVTATVIVSCSGNPNGTVTWNGSVDSDWNDCLNWTPNVVPTTGSTVVIPTGNTPIIYGGTNADCYSIQIQGTSTLTIQETLGASLDVVQP
ncbi:MAG: right-handed parallel beta-helix repeat-containing protein [Flavobacteriales bacterium]|nr:right-handed parallel beta-helix repeat-containing protein [Flavobacteriales bacterium]